MISLQGQLSPLPETLVALLEGRARVEPEKTAYIYLRDGRLEDARINYAQLSRRAQALAAALQTDGVTSGERALLLFPAGIEFLIALFGCLYAGVIPVPAPAPEGSRIARTLPRLNAIAGDARASLLLSNTPILAAIAREQPGEGPLGSMRCVDIACIDETQATRWRPPVVDGDSLAYLQYTSGSTSAPKGVCITHAHVLCHLDALANGCCGYSSKSVTVNWMPYFHDYGLVEGMLLPLFNGTPCVLMSPYALIKQPANWLRAISHYGATHSQAPNFAYALCTRRVDRATIAELDLSAWQCAGNAAEPINPEVMAAFADKFAAAGFRYQSFAPGYGLAEATLIVTYKAFGDSPRTGKFERAALEKGQVRRVTANDTLQSTRAIVSCGRPLKDTLVEIVDPESRERAAADTIGEIWVSSPAVARGYWERERATTRTFHARLAGSGEQSFLRTGDLGFLHDGELYVCGRLKDLIIVHGQNVSPQDVEWTVQQAHPALKPDAGAAFSVEVDGEERLVVVQEVQGQQIRDLDEAAACAAIRSAVGEALGLELHAIALLRPGGISKTSSGKIQRSACRTMFLDGTLNALAIWRQPRDSEPSVLRPSVIEPPSERAIRDFVMTRIAAAVGESVEAIDPREPFTRFGLDSVRAVALVGELEAWLERELPATLAFDYPNAEAIARYLSAGDRESRGASPSTRQERQPIAIVGIGCRFPGGMNDPEHFWQGLRAGFDGVSEVPAQRWDAGAWYASEPGTAGRMNTRWGGFVEDVDAFDASFFGISPREARCVDPQQRMLLEVSWEALEHAGIAADQLAGSRTGVFIGICSNDYQRLQAAGEGLGEGYAATGNALSIAANRISYTFDLVGPSWAVDTACSSSLVAVHQACRSLLAGEADLALAGGVNLVLDPAVTVAFSQSRMMSPTGRCRTFSDDADGYVRAEGCGVIVLKRLADAERDGNRIIAVIRGSAVNQDGRSNGLTAPSGPSQKAVVREALADAGVTPAQVGYVEAHGTGTPLGDPIELNALAEVLREGRSSEQRCWIGSVKTNIGHLEGAAGIAGLIKVALCVERGEIPRNLHFRALNPHIRIEGSGLGVPRDTQRWPGETGARIAGVSSFGFGGTNAHVIVSAPRTATRAPAGADRPFHLLCTSARSREALNRLLNAYAQRLCTLPDERLGDFCFTINAGRSVFPYRTAAVAASSSELGQVLMRMASSEGTTACSAADYGKATSKAPPLMFLFGDLLDPPPGTGTELFRTSTAFAHAVERCIAHLDEDGGAWLRMRFAGVSEEDREVPQEWRAIHAFSLQYASWELWRSWGVRADVLCGMGHGLLAAACAAGVLSLEQAARLCLTRKTRHPEQTLAEIAFSAPDTPLRIAPAAASTEFEDALLKRLHGLGTMALTEGEDGVWLEVGPRTADDHRGVLRNASLLPGFEAMPSEWRALLVAVGRLFVAGIAVDWTRLDVPFGRRRIDAPTYPFQRERYWFSKTRSELETGATAAVDGPEAEGARFRTEKGRAAPAFGTAAHLDWLASELGRLAPSKRRRLLERFVDDARPAAIRAPHAVDSPLTVADIRGLSEEEAEAVLRKRLESMNF